MVENLPSMCEALGLMLDIVCFIFERRKENTLQYKSRVHRAREIAQWITHLFCMQST